ncbi:MAG: HlyD family type I secretion periplasmic adaptor subunit, partial [Proteobacteria bacterium]|nr:HlyD family type I secretion periplasmic adaptor subunit [Pseudomonadota bacterium]
GRLDIVAVSDGKLVPSSYLKIVQPSEQGVVKEILVEEGERVRAGQVLVRMDAVMATADARTLANEFHSRRLALRRIDAQLAGAPMRREETDPEDIFTPAHAQYTANVAALQNAVAQEKTLLDKARSDLASAREVHDKLLGVLPHYRAQEAAFDKLARGGYAGKLLATDKARERIEKEQDLKSQKFIIQSNAASIEQSERRIAQLAADYRRQLQAERSEVAVQLEKARQELAKVEHRQSLLELRAPQAGLIKDLATHTPGTVVSPGTILMTLVPQGETLRAEVWVSNQDIGFVQVGQPAKVKLAAFPFQKYGMVDARVAQVSADATEAPSANTRSDALFGRDRPMGPLAFRAIVELKSQRLEAGDVRHTLTPGMQVVAEIKLGERTLLEYLLSPVQKVVHEAARER